jgi:hypothetical protein
MQDVLIAVVDGLKGFPEAITAIFPQALVQTCIVHLIRHSLSFCNWKDRQRAAEALREIYRAESAESARIRMPLRWHSYLLPPLGVAGVRPRLETEGAQTKQHQPWTNKINLTTKIPFSISFSMTAFRALCPESPNFSLMPPCYSNAKPTSAQIPISGASSAMAMRTASKAARFKPLSGP